MQYEATDFAIAEDGTRLFHGVAGTGSAIVLNDGIGCDGFAWKYLQPALAARHTVIHWHYRGHGRSGAPRDMRHVDVPSLAQDLATILDRTNQQSAVIMGHSLGTQVALEFYRRYPERTRALVLMCGSYGRVTETFRGTAVLKTVLPGLIEAVQNHKGAARALWGRVPPGFAFRVARLMGDVDGLAIREDDFRTYWEHINMMDPDIFLPMLNAAGEHSAEDLLPIVAVPTLVIAAERDTFTPPELAEHMAALIPDAEHLLIRGGSHAAPVEQPDMLHARIERFLLERVPEERGTDES